MGGKDFSIVSAKPPLLYTSRRTARSWKYVSVGNDMALYDLNVSYLSSMYGSPRGIHYLSVSDMSDS